MKKNIVTGFLAFAVLSIWCIIFYRLFGSSEDIEKISQKPKVTVTKKSTAKLSLRYSDPFKIKKVIAKKRTIISKPIIVEQPPAFRYKGLISGTNSKLVIIENNQRQELIELKDSLLGFKIISINNDSVVVQRKRTKYKIAKI